MNEEKWEDMLRVYGRNVASEKIPDEVTSGFNDRLKERIARKGARRASAGIPAWAFAGAAGLMLAAGVFLFYLPKQEAVKAPLPLTAFTKTTDTANIDRYLDSLSDEKAALLILELNDEELLWSLGDEFLSIDLEAAEFVETAR